MLMKLTVTIKKNGQISYVLHKHAYKERRRKSRFKVTYYQSVHSLSGK